jgi:hypothetical protein
MNTTPATWTDSAKDLAALLADETANAASIEASWFAASAAPQSRAPSSRPPAVQDVGQFLGDELADAWLR